MFLAAQLRSSPAQQQPSVAAKPPAFVDTWGPHVTPSSRRARVGHGSTGRARLVCALPGLGRTPRCVSRPIKAATATRAPLSQTLAPKLQCYPSSNLTERRFSRSPSPPPPCRCEDRPKLRVEVRKLLVFPVLVLVPFVAQTSSPE
jgi:hypothetical protein